MVEHQFSKLIARVRFSHPAHGTARREDTTDEDYRGGRAGALGGGGEAVTDSG